MEIVWFFEGKYSTRIMVIHIWQHTLCCKRSAARCHIKLNDEDALITLQNIATQTITYQLITYPVHLSITYSRKIGEECQVAHTDLSRINCQIMVHLVCLMQHWSVLLCLAGLSDSNQ